MFVLENKYVHIYVRVHIRCDVVFGVVAKNAIRRCIVDPPTTR